MDDGARNYGSWSVSSPAARPGHEQAPEAVAYLFYLPA